ncbi:MAG: Rpn family recombination-promoting nuclease/putative transposase [Magnetococcales bacterium]|nr:Rpn family recombination-promoting nuclease/putative transposase [Magnetococcales bacterium]NGZ26370.1 Rpn family recombination-promoting nuclease/putative transposase [Magnetococcales bacterium]
MSDPIHDSDSIYHRFFSHPEMVIDLLMAFLPPALLVELDLKGLRRHNTKFTAMLGQRRRSDVIWEIPTRQGGSVFLLLILEFQSDVEQWMALRVNVYTGLLYQQLVDERRLNASDGLPPVLAINLYNGDQRWNAAASVRDLIRLPTGTSLWNFQPEMQYYTIDEGAYPKEVLEGLPFLSAILCRMEHPASPEELVRAGKDAAEWFEKHPDGPPVKELFRDLLIAGLKKMAIDPLPNIPDKLQEVVMLSAARVEKWAMDYEHKGKADMLLDLIQDRFGSVPDWVRPKLFEADLDTLKRWSKRIFGAEKIEQIFQ